MESAFTLAPINSHTDLRSPPLRELFDQWLAARTEGLPSADGILLETSEAVRDRFWRFDQTGDDFICRGMGRQAVRIYGGDLTGRCVMTLVRNPIIGRVLLVLRSVVRERAPHRFFSETSVVRSHDFYDIEVVALPVTAADGAFGILGATAVHHM